MHTNHAAHDDVLEAAGEKLTYRRLGRGPDLLFVHGWPLNSDTFREIAPALARDYTCHLIDLPGAGRSPRSDALAPGFRPLIAVLRAAADALGLSRYALIAHDSGGVLARQLAAQDSRVAGLVLGNTELPGHYPPPLQALHRFSNLRIGPALLRASWRIGVLRRSAQFGFGNAFADRRLLDREFLRLYLRPILESNATMAHALIPLRDYDRALMDELANVHARIRVPVRLIWGTADRLFPLSRAQQMLRQFGGATGLVRIEGARLFAHEERPDEFVAFARPFLEGVFADAQ